MSFLNRFKKDDAPDLAAEARREARNQLREFVDSIHDGFVRINSNAVVVTWNRQAEEIFGYGRVEAEGKYLHDLIIPEEFHEAHVNGIKRYLETGIGPLIDKTLEVPALTKSGKKIPIRLHVTPQIIDGETYFNAFIQDISELKEAVLDRERYEVIVASMQDALYAVDAHHKVLTWNNGAETLYGWTADEVIGNNINLIVPEGYINEVDSYLERTLKGEVFGPFLTKRITKKGKILDVNIVVSPLKDVTGDIIGASLLARDIGIELEGQKRQQLLAAIVDNSSSVIFSMDKEGVIRSVNPAVDKVYGWKPEELVGQSIWQISSPANSPSNTPERIAESKKLIDYVNNGGIIKDLERESIRRDGSRIITRSTVFPLYVDGGKMDGIAAIITDITDEHSSSQQLTGFFNLTLDLLCIIDREGRFITVNPAWEKVLGYSKEELEGRKYIDFVHPEDREMTNAEDNSIYSGTDAYAFVNRYVAKDGSIRRLRWRSMFSEEENVYYSVASDITNE